MTLTKLKYNTKVVGYLLFVLIYTGTIFFVGKYSNQLMSVNIDNNGRLLSKSTQSKIENPQGLGNAVQKSQVLSSFIKLCSNTALGFELAYPQDWFTSYNDSKDQCMYFAPYSFVLPQVLDQEITPISIKIINPQEWENTLKLYQNPNELYNVITSTNLEINGQSVTKIKSAATGSSSLQRGNTRIVYLIFDSNTPMVATYSQLETKDDIQQYEKTLEDIVESLKFF